MIKCWGSSPEILVKARLSGCLKGKEVERWGPLLRHPFRLPRLLSHITLAIFFMGLPVSILALSAAVLQNGDTKSLII